MDFSNPSIFGPTKKKVSSHVARRVNVLNNIFMQHITDLLSTGEIAPELLERNIEISHIDVSPDFKTINIFWVDNDIDMQPDMPELLKKCSFKLRHELHQLHIIGKLPAIQFVQCKGIGVVREVEEKLKTLDFGEDHVPSPYPYATKHTVTAKACSNTEEKLTKNKKLEDTNDIFSVILPEMRHNVFDLNHDRIMSKIKCALHKSPVTSKKHVMNTQPSLTPLPKHDLQNKPVILTSVEQQEEFSKFLIQRRKQQRHLNKQKYCKNDISRDLEDDDDDDEGEYEAVVEEEEPDYLYNEDDSSDIDNIDNEYKDYFNRQTEDKY